LASLKRVAVCAAQVPFVWGGAEILVEALSERLRDRGIQVEVVKLPFKWYPKEIILRHSLAWRMLDLTESNGVPIDAVICTNFPSYVVAHPRKIVWLVHQHRHAYELLGTPFGDFTDSPADREIRDAIVTLDARVLGETEHRYAISANVARRLERYNGLSARPLYPPPRSPEAYHCDDRADYILTVSRLDPIKRIGLLLQALAQTGSRTRCVIAGKGPHEATLREEARNLGLGDRVTFAGWIDDKTLVDLYAGALAVYFAPFDEDYGYVTVESFLSGKPVLTTTDAGGALEFVRDCENGLVRRPEPAEIAGAIDQLAADAGWAARMGRAGRRSVENITWDRTIDTLLGGL
jgi:glycosyltransferase involved in cell wall biosynthesis